MKKIPQSLVQVSVRHKPFFKMPPGWHWGMRKRDGDLCNRGDLLVNQQGLRFYPGENVRLDHSTCSLYALEAGQVVISSEKVSPRKDSPLYETVNDKNVTIYKEFFNIIPKPQPQKFKLVEML